MINQLFAINAEFIPDPHADEHVLFVKVPEILYLHHLRLGHPGEHATKSLVKSVLKASVKDDTIKCELCVIAKHTATPHLLNALGQCTYHPLELIVADTCGPFPIMTPHRKEFFVAFQNIAMKVNNLQLTLDKTASTMLEAFKILKAQWERRTSHKIKRFRCDGGPEWKGVFEDYLLEQGIEIEVTPHYKHWMNGKIEHFMRTVQGCILAMLTMAQLPLTYWGKAALMACYLLNLTTVDSDRITPFKRMYGCPPNLSYLCIWGT